MKNEYRLSVVQLTKPYGEPRTQRESERPSFCWTSSQAFGAFHVGDTISVLAGEGNGGRIEHVDHKLTLEERNERCICDTTLYILRKAV